MEWYEKTLLKRRDSDEITLLKNSDDNTMQKVDVMNALNEAVIFCSNYKIK